MAEEVVGGVETFTDVPDKVVDTDDGGAIVTVGDDVPTQINKEWYDNIADDFDDATLTTIATRLLEDIERDKKAREKREKDYEEVHKNLGRIPFSYIISGARDSGKTVTAHSLLKFYSSYMDIIHIWSPNASLDFKWGAVIEEYEIHKKNIHKNYSEIF